VKTDRLEFLKALDLIKPAVASKALLDELTHIWLGSKHLTAYDDILGIRAPFECGDMAGGVKGALLLGLLNASGAKNIELDAAAEGKEAHLKAAKAKAKLALLEASRAVWEYPKVKAADFVPLSKELLAGLADVMIAVGSDVSNPDQLGVTFALEEDGLTLYATDAKTIARSHVAVPKGYDEEHLIVPAPFAEQVLRLCGADSKFAVLKGGVLAETKGGVGIFARQLDSPNPSDFSGALERVLPKGYGKDAVKIPGVMKMAIERALVILDGKLAEPISMEVADNALFLKAVSPLGELDDEIHLEEGKKHKDVSIKIDPVLVKRGLDRCDHMLVTEGGLALLGRDLKFLYMIAAS
jgi:DNA polymerase III sliding clamp (beta) subunit (PCNA family)